jgi:hypothetical protein
VFCLVNILQQFAYPQDHILPVGHQNWCYNNITFPEGEIEWTYFWNGSDEKCMHDLVQKLEKRRPLGRCGWNDDIKIGIT